MQEVRIIILFYFHRLIQNFFNVFPFFKPLFPSFPIMAWAVSPTKLLLALFLPIELDFCQAVAAFLKQLPSISLDLDLSCSLQSEVKVQMLL